LFDELEKIEFGFKKKSDSIDSYGYALLYGKWAVVASIGISKPIIKARSTDIYQQAKDAVIEKLGKWKAFDKFAESKREETNSKSGRYWTRTSDPCRVKTVLYRLS
jgi:hypothetical protein